MKAINHHRIGLPRNLALVMGVAVILASGCTTTETPQSAVDQEQMLADLSRNSEYPLQGGVYMPEGVKFTKAHVYGHVDGRDLTADIITPAETPLEPRPALVSLHGGSWKAGSPAQFHFHSAYFAARYGIFSMCVDYRLSGEAPFPAALQDAKCAVRWIRAHSKELNIDPQRIAIIGGSAGGHLSSMVATTAGVPEYEGDGGNPGFSSHVNLAILINGEFDMWDLVEKKSLIDEMRAFMGGTPEEVPERYDELSSVKRIHKDVPPVLLLHGTHDLCVSHEQSLAFRDRCLEMGVHAEVELYPKKPHAWFNREPDRTIVLKRIEKFLVEQFRLGPAPAARPRVYQYHPMENGIRAKGHCMTYLVVGDEGAVMVDPGRGTAHEEIMAFIRSCDLEPKDVKWAVLTHAHLDHTGGAHLIQKEGIPVATSAFTAMAVEEAEIDMVCKKEHRPEVSCKVDRILKDGDVLEVGAMRVEVMAIPGHTEGCLAFVVDTEEGRTIFTGDLIRHTGHSGWTGSRTYSFEESIRSIRKLLALKPDKAYWGHSDVEGDAQEWLRTSLKLYEEGTWVMN